MKRRPFVFGLGTLVVATLVVLYGKRVQKAKQRVTDKGDVASACLLSDLSAVLFTHNEALYAAPISGQK